MEVIYGDNNKNNLCGQKMLALSKSDPVRKSQKTKIWSILYPVYDSPFYFISTSSPAFISCRFSFFFLFCFMMASLTSVRWSLIVVLICFSLIISDVEHLFLWFLAISMSSLEKCVFRSADFLIGLFACCCLILSCVRFLYILDINPLSVTSFAYIFSYSVGCLFGFFLWFPLLCKNI